MDMDGADILAQKFEPNSNAIGRKHCLRRKGSSLPVWTYDIMPRPSLPKIVPHLWYTKEAEEAARFYSAVFPDSHVDRVTSLPADSAIGPAGSVVIVDFTLFGQTFMAMSVGPNDPFNEAISLRVNCSSQSEIDKRHYVYAGLILESRGRVKLTGSSNRKLSQRHYLLPHGTARDIHSKKGLL